MSDLPEDAKNEAEAAEPQGAGESGEDQVATDSAAPDQPIAAGDQGVVNGDGLVDEPVGDAVAESAEAGEQLEPSVAEVESAAGEVADAEKGGGASEAADEEAEKPKPAPPKSGLLEFIEEPEDDPDAEKDWYILKVAVNREPTIAAALQRRVAMHGLEQYFGDIIVPTEEQTEFTKAGKKRKVKKKLYPGYIVVNMAINDETWFLVRETGGIGDFTGAAGKPAPLQKHEIDRILNITNPKPEDDGQVHNISHKIGDRVRVNEGYFQNFEGVVDSIDVNSGRVTVLITIFNRTAPVELEHWHIEAV